MKKKSLLATVSERSSHTVPTPHGGGIAVAVTWFAGLIYLYLSKQIETTLFFALMLGALIAIVGLIDDVIDLSPKIRMIAFSFVSVVGIFIIGGLNSIDFGLFSIENQIVTNTFAFLFILWYINLTNFIDGINGYVGAEFVFLSLAGFLLFGSEHFLLLGVSVLGFLFWNWNRAKIFMGDVGSTLLGYNIAVFTLYYANQEPSNLWVWITLFGVFWFDATMTLIRRKLHGERLSQAHKKHAYQRLTQAGWSHLHVSSWAIVINAILFLLIWLIPNVALSFTLSLVLLYSVYRFIDSKKSLDD